MQAASDLELLERADAEIRVLISAYTDFGALLAMRRSRRPSVVLIRRLVGRRAADQAAIILANLESMEGDLVEGAVAVLGDDCLRIRRLPLLP
ncbi:hypothetical protein GCM10020369_62250 [Cryptosporangium minutisporangium]|uniref:DUF5615 domain-containing protein n=1 Tax=Cryptosporangium minutisporangium TaxID=113569 RepID=A0ABP6T867_9ACTN